MILRANDDSPRRTDLFRLPTKSRRVEADPLKAGTGFQPTFAHDEARQMFFWLRAAIVCAVIASVAAAIGLFLQQP